VHIADVSHYVKEGSALDEEAYERGTSCISPSVPCTCSRRNCDRLCSLNPHVDRLVQTCVMDVDRARQRRQLRDARRVINSNARMTYNAVNAILTDRDPDAGRSTRRWCRCSR
jgi:ribonuclease R